MDKGKYTSRLADGASTPGTPLNRLAEPAQRQRARHSAITRNLYSWSSYKSWAEKMKNTLDADKTKP